MLRPLGYTFLPRWVSERAMYLYMGLLLVVGLLFHGHLMPWYFVLFGLVEVCGFFYYANYLTKEWNENVVRAKVFEKRLFITSLSIRVVYVLLSYWFYSEMTGTPFEFSAADSMFYHSSAVHGAQLIREGHVWDFWYEYTTLKYVA